MIKEIAILLFLMNNSPINSGENLIYKNVTPKDLSVPYQENIKDEDVFVYKNANIKKLAKFEIKARILGKERYYTDTSSEYSKYDLAMGWGPFYNIKNLDHLKINQGNRWFTWRADKLMFPYKVYVENMSNIHIIPASSNVEDKVSKLSKDDGVILKGYLVSVKGFDGFSWNSSMTRSDTGDGACEVFYVESVDIID